MKMYMTIRHFRQPRRTSAAAGVSIIELMAALSIIAIAMLGSMIMVVIGMQTNSNGKTDTTATILDQEVIEKFATLKNYPKPGTVTIYDCALAGGNANQHQASIGAGAGATLYTAANAPMPSMVGDVNWTAAAPVYATSAVAGYAMLYQTCSGEIYEVRWNIAQISPVLSLLTVSARPRAAQIMTAGLSQSRAILYARPVTLRTMIVN